MNRLVRLPNKSMRSLARQTLKGKWTEAVMISLLAAIITSVPGMIVSLLPNGGGVLSYIVTLYGVVINGPITLSLSYYFLKVFRMEKTSVQDIKYGLNFIMKAMHLYCRMFIFIWLWSLLFIIPGFIASIRYSQAFYLMADNEGKTAPQCMNESIFIMRGNMLKYFLLMLSFAGWFILAYIPAGIYLYREVYPVIAEQVRTALESGADVSQLMGITYNPGPLFSLLSLPSIVVSVYLSTTEACFFDILSGGLLIQPEEAEEEAVSETEDNNG
ncbi:MAG: DUF975 family protein [Firmicutes bacterium]|nr:DUF975 family protein [Bacillota bacterium]